MSHSKIRVGVVRGGPSSEYEVSLKTGEVVLRNLPEKYEAIDIFVSEYGAWHIKGLERKIEQIIPHIDVFWNAMHGEFGEDGKVQHILSHFGIPFTGSQVLGSSLAMNKIMAKKIVSAKGIKTPESIIVNAGSRIKDSVRNIFGKLKAPFIIKPVSLGSSIGVVVAKEIESLEKLLVQATQKFGNILVEEKIVGKEASVGVINNFRGNEFYSLPAVEIIPPKDHDFFSFNAKYEGNSLERCPGYFSKSEKKSLEKIAITVHELLGLRHYSRSDFIVHPKKGIYFLEVNTLPGLTPQSLFPLSLEAVGCQISQFLDHVLTMALKKR